MTARLDEKRNHYRIRTALPVYLGTTRGFLRDMSTSGAYFWTSGSHSVGEQVNFLVQLQSPEGRTAWNCQGDVVRVEPRDSDTGVAVRIKNTTVATPRQQPAGRSNRKKTHAIGR